MIYGARAAAATAPPAAAPKLSLVQRATAAANVKQQQRTNDNNNRSISFGSVRPFWPLWGRPSGSVGRTLEIITTADARRQDTLCVFGGILKSELKRVLEMALIKKDDDFVEARLEINIRTFIYY